MFAVQPIRIYSGVEICQVFYHSIEGKVNEYCSSKYQNNTDIQPSLIYTEFDDRPDRQRRLEFDS